VLNYPTALLLFFLIGITTHLDAMGVVNQPVQDACGDCDRLVSPLGRKVGKPYMWIIIANIDPKATYGMPSDNRN
jgi:hypothetical protein